MPTSIEINDAEIEKVATELGLDLGGSDRRAVLRCTESKDIQAGPGCGKTTLLVAKLAILASQWKWRDRGICVLSHTNVAREEVQKRLSMLGSGGNILNYPHFVHTIQTFVDKFLALPYLRSIAQHVTYVDTIRYGAHATNLLRKYQTASNYLRGQRFAGLGPQDILASLHYIDSAGSIECSLKSLGIKNRNARSYVELQQLKQELVRCGAFSYEDMYYFASLFLSEHPEITAAFRYRFPWVLIDELQDTNLKQQELLSILFNIECIVQRFGDENQAIFLSGQGTDQQNLFQDNPLDVQGSMRFGPTIAQYVSRLAIRGTTVSGHPSVKQCRNTIFVFDYDTIHLVLPAYGNLLLDEYQDFSDNFVAKAIGAVHRQSNSDKPANTPNCVSDYWRQYTPEVLTSSPRPNSLLQATQKARHIIGKDKQLARAYNVLIDAVVDFLSLASSESDRFIPITRTRAKQLLASSDANCVNELKLLLLKSCSTPRISKQDEWIVFTNEFEQCLLRIVSFTSNSASKQFLEWTELESNSADLTVSSNVGNVYSHEREGRRVNIELGSIHSVKGETHSAALVLETHQWSHDLGKVLPFLAGKETVGENTGKQVREHLKRIFVAMSRPRELVCLAIRNDHVAQYENELKELGWHIQHV